MTRTKLWRLSLAAILGFGWLFLTPAYSDDPLSLADQEIKELRSKVADLNYKDDFVHLIEQAEEQYDEAVSLKQEKDDAFDAYNNAVEQEARELSDINAEQHAIDTQKESIAEKLINKNDAYDTLDAANISLAAAQAVVNAAGNQGVSFQIYPLSRNMYGQAYIEEGAGLMCQGSIPSLNVWAGWGAICGLHDNIIGIFTTTLTVPEEIDTVKFAGYTDDGFRLYVDGVIATSQWQEQGATWSPYTEWYDTSTDKTLELQAWWYNGGGPGSMHVGWGHSNIWTGISAEYLSYGQQVTQEQLDALDEAIELQGQAQENYDLKLAEYNSAVNLLSIYETNLEREQDEYAEAQQNTVDALQEKEDSINEYDQSIIDLNIAIDNAWEYYKEQLDREIAIAIAQALANQPQPEPTPDPTPQTSPSPEPELTPEPSSEPTSEPEPEQTEPSDPIPTPEPETTDEPKPEPTVDPEPTPEPSPEPSPLPSDIGPEPTPEPKPTPVEPSSKPSNNSITENLNALANLTSKDNKLVTLTPEQATAVANVLIELAPEAKQELAKDLGIKSEEIAVLAEAMKDNPILASAVVEFSDRAKENTDAPMPYTLADATTELAAEQLLSDPIGALTNIDFDKVLDPSQWGKDMTDDQREKAQEVIVPVIIATNIVAAAMTRRI